MSMQTELCIIVWFWN